MAREKKAKATEEHRYQLYLMRHGLAANADGPGPADDAKRQLTPEGRLKLRGIAKGLQRAGVELDWIVSSPLVRAVETAEIIAEELAPSAARDSSDALAPGEGSGEKLTAFLVQHPERRRVLLAGHEPSLSQIAGELIGAGREASLAFKKGGCCLIEFDRFPSRSPGQLVWWFTPRLLRKLGT